MRFRNLSLTFSILLSTLAMIATSCGSKKQMPGNTITSIHPKREFRGAWISTAWQTRYRKMDSEEMKKYLSEGLDKLKENGINAVIFQVRPQADAFYKSKYEPWSMHLTGIQGKVPDNGFDPLAFMVDECHKRNMELHAWINPYRVTTSESDVLTENHIYYREPYRFLIYDGKKYFDPGIPENRKYTCKIVKDIVLNYDVDAIHMDDYFYPYPVAGKRFPDQNSFATYAYDQGFNQNELADWRRNNVNMLVKEIKETITTTKPWVRFGISPFGIYRNKSNTPDGSGSKTSGLQNYDDLYADVKLWVDSGWVDYNMPQIYWEIGHRTADYQTLLKWWVENNKNQHLYIGQDVKRSMDGLGKNQLCEKVELSREFPNVGGNCFWPAYDLLDNYKGVKSYLNDDLHKYPALIPQYTHMSKKEPKKVKKLKVEYTSNDHVLKWESQQDKLNPESAQYFVIYRFGKKEKENLNDVSKIVATTRNNHYSLPYEGKKDTEYVYVVTAVNSFHNESKGQSKKIKL